MQFPAVTPTLKNIEVTRGRAWTVFTVKGEICRAEIIEAIDLYFPKLPCGDVIWDFSTASVGLLNSADFEAIAERARAHGAKRNDGRTVFVSANPGVFAAIGQYIGVAALKEVGVDYAAFLTLEEGERWLICNRTHKCGSGSHVAGDPMCRRGACRSLRLFQAHRRFYAGREVDGS